jgi:hypothetical protein
MLLKGKGLVCWQREPTPNCVCYGHGLKRMQTAHRTEGVWVDDGGQEAATPQQWRGWGWGARSRRGGGGGREQPMGLVLLM